MTAPKIITKNLKFTFSVCLLTIVFIPNYLPAHGYPIISRANKCTGVATAVNLNTGCGLVQWEPQSVEGSDRFPATGPADGQLASAGIANFSELDEQTSTRWHKTSITTGPIDFTWHLTANHSSLDWRYFITKQNWNPNQALTRNSFDLTPFCTFNDGGTIPPFDFTHACTIPANYTGYHVIYAVWDVADTPASFYHVLDVNIGTGTGNIAPTAQVNGPYAGEINTDISFDSTGSNDPDGTISSYLWDFGDGQTSSVANPTHQYTAANNYTVSLTVTDNGSLASIAATTSATIVDNSINDLIFANSFDEPGTTPPTSGKVVAGYFTEWGIYGRNYHVKNIVTSNSAAKLTHIIYAFGNVVNGQCVIGDAEAAHDKIYTAAESIDGVADVWNAPLRGNFNQLFKLKQMYPNIKILWSFGGWTWSGGFAQAASNPQAFANSCYDLLHDARWDGLFAGIDIDWEYPNACGLTCDTSGFDAYRNLMQALRTRFGSELVTAAIAAGSAKINAADYAGAAQYMDYYFVMAYDFFGAWSATGPTAPHSPLTSYAGIPQPDFYSDAAIQLLLSKGVPAAKLNLGIGFYGRGWTGVTQSTPGGTATGPATGTYEAGNEDYKVLKSSCPTTAEIAGTAYAYCGNNWWSYDTPSTIATKMNYVNSHNLAGSFFWELSGDTADGELIEAIAN